MIYYAWVFQTFQVFDVKVVANQIKVSKYFWCCNK